MSFRSFRFLLLPLSTLLAMALIVGCSSTAPPPPETEPAVTEAMKARLRPQITDVVVSRNGAVVEWQINRTRDDIIRGYDVYVSTQPGLASLDFGNTTLNNALYNQSTYPGDTDGDIRSESIVLERLQTGQRYHVHVRTLFANGESSVASAEVEFMPRPQGMLTLNPRLSGDNDGYSFAEDTTVEWMSLTNDLYLYTVRDTAYLASPSRLNGELRETRFVTLGFADDFSSYPEIPAVDGLEKIALKERQLIGLRLDDDRIAKLRVVSINRDVDPLAVTFQYRYQPVAGETEF